VRFSERTLKALDQLCRPRLVCLSLEDCKFITAQPAHNIRPPQYLAKSLGNTFKQRISSGMSKSVIHPFEAIEINPVKRKSVPVLYSRTPIFQLFIKLMPVGNLGQRVMTRKPIDFLFRSLPLGYVLLNINPSATGKGLVAH